MNKREKYTFLFFTFIYGIHLIFKFGDFPSSPWMSSYLADVVCLPLMLLGSTFLIRKMKRDKDIQLKTGHILFVWIYVSLVFEWLLPLYSSKYTQDPIDVLAYGLGGLLFYFIQNRSTVIIKA